MYTYINTFGVFFFSVHPVDLQQSCSPSPYATVPAAMNLQRQSPVALRSNNGPEQCEALNLGKKDQGTNNNNAGENEEEPDQKRIKKERSPRVIVASRPGSPKMTSPERFPAPTINSPIRESSTSPERNGDDKAADCSNGTIEMDISVSAGKCANRL